MAFRAVHAVLLTIGMGVAALAARAAHPGPPIWGEFKVSAESVVFHLQGERKELAQLLGLPAAPLGASGSSLEAGFRSGLTDRFPDTVRVRIDGADVTPQLVELKVPDEDPERWTSLAVEATLRYPCERLPRDVAIAMAARDRSAWFDASALPLMIVYGRHGQMVYLTPDEPEFVWHPPAAELPGGLAVRRGAALVPVAEATAKPALRALLLALAIAAATFLVSLRFAGPWRALLAGGVLGGATFAWLARAGFEGDAPPPEPALARTIFETLHGNVYRAFDAATDEEIYDVLALGVEPGLLEQVYRDVFESLVLREDGGAVCTIREVERLSVGIRPAPPEADGAAGASAAFLADCRWRVRGEVLHYAHVHRRENEYDATYTVRQQDGAWRLAAIDVHDMKRVDR